jgi:hypothetical protein
MGRLIFVVITLVCVLCIARNTHGRVLNENINWGNSQAQGNQGGADVNGQTAENANERFVLPLTKPEAIPQTKINQVIENDFANSTCRCVCVCVCLCVCLCV